MSFSLKSCVSHVLDRLRKKPRQVEPKSQHPKLEEGIQNGAVLQGFLSGGGLRVVDLKSDASSPYFKNEKTGFPDGAFHVPGYGEASTLDVALRRAEEDAVAGGRPYREVYGNIQDQFPLPASFDPDSDIDAALSVGRSFDVSRAEDGKFQAVWTVLEFDEYPTHDPEGLRAHMYRATRTAVGVSIVDALQNAIRAPSVENKAEIIRKGV